MRALRAFLSLSLCLAASAALAEPSVRWLETRHDFGTFAEEDGPVTCEFKMVNDGPGNASIVAARATCGCTQPSFTVRSLAPGDTASLSVTFDPTGRPGRLNKQVYVETSVGKQRLDIVGVVIGSDETVARRFPVDCGPLKLETAGIMLGEVTKGQRKTVYSEGYNRSADSLRVSVVYKPAFVELIPSPAPASPGEQITLISYVNSESCNSYGLVEDSVIINVEGAGQYTLPITINVKEDFGRLSTEDKQKAPISVLSDEILDYGTPEAPVTQTFTIGNAGRNKLIIRRIYTSDPGVTIEYKGDEVSRGKKLSVAVTLDPAYAVNKYVTATVTVITNDPMQPVRTVRLAATINK